MKKFLGEKYGRLTVTDRYEDRAKCLCDCGNEADVRMDKLRRGETKSCGCLAAEHINQMKQLSADVTAQKAERARVDRAAREAARKLRTEERRKARAPVKQLEAVWSAMWSRCTSPANKSYPRYGGRGISVEPSWEKFEVFHEWAKAAGYTPGLWLERRENDGPYSPGNCTWATPKTQGRNRSNTRWITDGTRHKTLPEVAERLGIPYLKAYQLHRKLCGAGENPPHARHFLAIATKAP